MPKEFSTDVDHKPPARSIYERTDYIVNSDMSIPLSLARAWNSEVASEEVRRTGFPQNDRTAGYSPLAYIGPRIPGARG